MSYWHGLKRWKWLVLRGGETWRDLPLNGLLFSGSQGIPSHPHIVPSRVFHFPVSGSTNLWTGNDFFRSKHHDIGMGIAQVGIYNTSRSFLDLQHLSINVLRSKKNWFNTKFRRKSRNYEGLLAWDASRKVDHQEDCVWVGLEPIYEDAKSPSEPRPTGCFLVCDSIFPTVFSILFRLITQRFPHCVCRQRNTTRRL